LFLARYAANGMNKFYTFVEQITQGVGYASAGSVLISRASSTSNIIFSTSIGGVFLALAFASILVLPFRETKLAKTVIVVQASFSLAVLIVAMLSLFLDQAVTHNNALFLSLAALLILILIVFFVENIKTYREAIKLKGWAKALAYFLLALSFFGAAYVFAKVLVEQILSNKPSEPNSLVVILIVSVFLLATAVIIDYFSKTNADSRHSTSEDASQTQHHI